MEINQSTSTEVNRPLTRAALQAALMEAAGAGVPLDAVVAVRREGSHRMVVDFSWTTTQPAPADDCSPPDEERDERPTQEPSRVGTFRVGTVLSVEDESGKGIGDLEVAGWSSADGGRTVVVIGQQRCDTGSAR